MNLLISTINQQLMNISLQKLLLIMLQKESTLIKNNQDNDFNNFDSTNINSITLYTQAVNEQRN